MARSATPEVEVTERLRPTAAPVDAYVRPAEPERSNLWSVAQSLSGLDRELGSFATQRMAEAEETDKLRGQAAFYQDNANGFTEGVRSGSIPSFSSPGFMKGYKAAQGDVMGTQLTQAFQLDYMQWPGKNGTDPAAFESFLSGWLSDKLQGVNDPEVLRGLMPHVRALQGGMQNQFFRDLDKNIYGGSVQAHAAGVSQAIQAADTDGRGRPMGTDYEGLWGSISAKREAALLTGIRSEDFDKVMVGTIVGEALRNRDPGLLKLLDKTLPGTTYKISDTPEGRAAKMEATHQLEVLGRQALADQDSRDRKAAHEAKNRTEASAIDLILKDPNAPLPDDLLKEGSKYDGDFRIKVIGWQKTVREGGVAEDPKEVANVYEDIFAGGGMGAVKKALDRGVLRTAESIKAAVGFAKTLESEGGKAVLQGPTFRGIMTALKERTRDDTFVNPMDPDSGLSDAGLEAQLRYQRLLLEWRAQNPNAGEMEVLKAQGEIGDSVLKMIPKDAAGNPLKNESGRMQLLPEAGGQAQQPRSPSPSQPAAPAPQPQGGGEWWKQPVKALPGESTSDAAARKRWMETLPPERVQEMESRAKQRGMAPSDFANEFWKRMRTKGQQRSELPAEDQRAMAYAEQAGGIEDIIGTYLRPVEPPAATTAKLAPAARPVAQQVMAQARAAGLPPEVVGAIVWQESNFNPATRPTAGGKLLSTATGLFQLLNGDRKQYGLPAGAGVEAQIEAGIRKTKDNWNAAKAALGRDPTAAELYVVHYQGIGAGPAILKNPNAGFVETLNAWGRSRGAGNWGSRVLTANPWLVRDGIKTNADFIRWAGAKIEPKVAALSGGTRLASR